MKKIIWIIVIAVAFIGGFMLNGGSLSALWAKVQFWKK